jgi:hypothetical protein
MDDNETAYVTLACGHAVEDLLTAIDTGRVFCHVCDQMEDLA